MILAYFRPMGAITVHRVEPGTSIRGATGEACTVTDTCVVWRGDRDCYVTPRIYAQLEAAVRPAPHRDDTA
jgi:hypothetical protein